MVFCPICNNHMNIASYPKLTPSGYVDTLYECKCGYIKCVSKEPDEDNPVQLGFRLE